MDTFKIKQIRSVGDVLGDTFNYIRKYYKSLSKVIAVYVIAPLLLASIILGSIFGRALTEGMFEFDPAASPESMLGLGTSVIVSTFLFLIAILLLYAVIYRHLFFAVEGNIPSTVSEFSRGLFPRLLTFTGAIIFLGIVFVAVSGALFAAAIELSFLAFFLIIPALIYVSVKVLLFPVAYFVEGSGAFNALVRSWELTNGFFWHTFGVYLLISIVFGILSNLLSTPFLLVMTILGAGFGMDSAWMGTITTVFYSFTFLFQVLFFGAQSIAIGLQYFNLLERKEGGALSEKIGQLEKGVS